MEILPPHSIESEKAFLGACLFDSTKLDEHRAAIPTSEVFYDLRHRVIWETACMMRDEGKAVDSLTLYLELKTVGKLEASGGAEYVSTIITEGFAPDYHLPVILQRWAARAMLQACQSGMTKLYESQGNADIESTLQEVESEILSVNQRRVTLDSLHNAKELVLQTTPEEETT